MVYEGHQQISIFDFMIQNNLDPEHELRCFIFKKYIFQRELSRLSK